MHLAADESGRRPELYVLGERPARFLAETKSTIAWGLDGFPATETLFKTRFAGLPLTTPIAEFRSGVASHVVVTDLDGMLGHLLADANT